MSYHLKNTSISYINGFNVDDLTVMIENEIISHGLMKYVKKISIGHEGSSEGNPFSYDSSSKELSVNVDELVKYFYTLESGLEDNYLYNLMVLHYFICEIVKRVRLKNTDLKNVFDSNLKQILELQKKFEDNDRRYDVLSSRYPDVYSPFDRFIGVASYFETLNEFKSYERFTSFDEFRRNYGAIVLNGYQDYYPLHDYFSQYSDYEGRSYLKKFSWYKKDPIDALSKTSHLPLERRLILGMPIDFVDKRFIRDKVYKS